MSFRVFFPPIFPFVYANFVYANFVYANFVHRYYLNSNNNKIIIQVISKLMNAIVDGLPYSMTSSLQKISYLSEKSMGMLHAYL